MKNILTWLSDKFHGNKSTESSYKEITNKITRYGWHILLETTLPDEGSEVVLFDLLNTDGTDDVHVACKLRKDRLVSTQKGRCVTNYNNSWSTINDGCGLPFKTYPACCYDGLTQEWNLAAGGVVYSIIGIIELKFQYAKSVSRFGTYSNWEDVKSIVMRNKTCNNINTVHRMIDMNPSFKLSFTTYSMPTVNKLDWVKFRIKTRMIA